MQTGGIATFVRRWESLRRINTFINPITVPGCFHKVSFAHPVVSSVLCLLPVSLSSLLISLSHRPHQTKCSMPKKPSCRISKGNRCDRLTKPSWRSCTELQKKWSMSTSGVRILSCDTHLHVCAPVLRPDGHRCWTHALGCICLPQLWPWHKLQRSRPKVNVGL